MSDQPTPNQDPDHLSHADMMSALFANLVLQQANMAMMFLGKVPHPGTGKTVLDLEAAQMFIDNLEMIELKTKGNLTKDETGLLQQSLMNTRMTFVQATEKVATAAPPPAPPAPGNATPPRSTAAPASPPPTPGTPHTPDSSAPPPPPAPAPADADADERRKFVKKY
jgi:hypothetical protein